MQTATYVGDFSASEDKPNADTEWDGPKGTGAVLVARDLRIGAATPAAGGSYGTVRKAEQLEPEGAKDKPLTFAVKTVTLDRVNSMERFAVELDVQRQLWHPNIIRLHQEFRDKSEVHLVMDFYIGTDLETVFETYRENMTDPVRKGLFAENLPVKKQARYIWQMLSGIAYCHADRFCHRDIKPENYMLESNDPNAALKLIDFGLSCVFERGVLMTEPCGTTHFIAPEVLSRAYSETCDIWSIGVVAYTCATSYPPFRGNTDLLDLTRFGSARTFVDAQ